MLVTTLNAALLQKKAKEHNESPDTVDRALEA